MTTGCGRVRKQLGAFLDGELSGADRLFVSQHLTECPRCAEEQQEIRDLGEMLRATAPSRGAILARHVCTRGRGLALDARRGRVDQRVLRISPLRIGRLLVRPDSVAG